MHFRVKAARVGCFVVMMAECLVLYSLASAQSNSPATATIRRVEVLNHGGNFELEILASQPVTPRTLVVTGPDRLVIDFPNAVPGPLLHAIAVKGVHVRGVRTGLFESNPPVARIVVDLNSPQSYEVFPSGKSVIVKISGGAHLATVSSPAAVSSAPSGTASSPAPPAPEPAKPVPTLQVEFSDGKLRVWTDRAMLGDVLRAIGQQTGASVSVPPQADQEPVIAHLGPASPREVLSSLLDGAPYNVVLMGAGPDLSRVTSIVLTPRGAVTAQTPANYAPAPVEEATPEPEPPPPPVEQNPAQPAPDALPPPPQ